MPTQCLGRLAHCVLWHQRYALCRTEYTIIIPVESVFYVYVVVVVATHKMKLNETDFFNSRPFDNTSNLLVYSTQKHASILIYECTWHMAYTIHIYIYDVVALVALWLGAPCMGNTAPQHHTSHTWCTKNPGRERERKKNRTGGSYIFEGTVNQNGWVIHFAPHPSA